MVFILCALYNVGRLDNIEFVHTTRLHARACVENCLSDLIMKINVRRNCIEVDIRIHSQLIYYAVDCYGHCVFAFENYWW